jgi:hypothetical protein
MGFTEAKSENTAHALFADLWSRRSMSDDSPAHLPRSEGQTGPESNDQRAAQRFTLLIRNAKIVFPSGEFLCVIRDVSATGLRIKTFHRMPAEPPLYLEMATGEQYGVSVVWANADQMGLQFLEPQDVTTLIREDGPFPKRSMRVMLTLPARISVGGELTDVTILNISQHGASLKCRERLAIEQQIILSASFLPDVDARVRWRKDDQYGLAFGRTFPISEFAQLMARLQMPSLAIAPDSEAYGSIA